MGWQDRDYSRSGDGSGGDFTRGVAGFFSKSFPIGNYLGVRVRVHIAFILLVVGEMVFFGNIMWTLRWSALLFFSVLLHEFGHCLGCRAVGGRADDILMWPLGGLAYCAPPRRPWPEFVTVACGPLVNVVLAAGAYLTVRFWTSLAVSELSLNPGAFWSSEYVTGAAGILMDVYAVNYALLLFNLLLVFYPFDGGRLVQIGLWKIVGYYKSMLFATRVGMVGAVLVGIYGLSIGRVLLAFIALFGFITCYRQGQALRSEGPENLYDPGYYNTRRNEDRPGMLARWRTKRSQKKRDRAAAAQAELEFEIDRILQKVSEHGLHSLTNAEKKTLQRETDRKRHAG